jgi:hypothetical protein
VRPLWFAVPGGRTCRLSSHNERRGNNSSNLPSNRIGRYILFSCCSFLLLFYLLLSCYFLLFALHAVSLRASTLPYFFFEHLFALTWIISCLVAVAKNMDAGNIHKKERSGWQAMRFGCCASKDEVDDSRDALRANGTYNFASILRLRFNCCPLSVYQLPLLRSLLRPSRPMCHPFSACGVSLAMRLSCSPLRLCSLNMGHSLSFQPNNILHRSCIS